MPELQLAFFGLLGAWSIGLLVQMPYRPQCWTALLWYAVALGGFLLHQHRRQYLERLRDGIK